MKPETKIEKWKILGSTFKVVKHKCPRCNRYFRDLNMHDKTSRCGRTADQRKLTKSDKERIAAVGLEIAIKKVKP